MAQARKRPARKARRARTAATSKPAPPDRSDRFVKDLIVRGEAQELTKQGKLPLDATHVIEKRNPDGTVNVRRVRFKAY